ncbi:MAG: tRNA lysidine(34) synthetase TilS [Minicystis sp.]
MTTRRSHPPSLLRLVERLARDERLFARGDVVLCACSGGPDSTALLHVLARLRETIGHMVVAHGVDHGLRAEAAAELDVAARVAEPLGVPFEVTRLQVAPGANLQARARAARHEALARAAAAAGARLVATGHTADDRAETFLLRLLRGAGPRGLAVLPPRAPSPAGGGIELIRPLLGARRRDVLAHLERHALPFARDPSNLDPRFTRVRVRSELVPLLEDLSPGIVAHLSSLADMLDAEPDDAALDGLGRAQRLAVERARRLGRRSVRLRLPGGREVEATFPDGRIVLIESR